MRDVQGVAIIRSNQPGAGVVSLSDNQVNICGCNIGHIVFTRDLHFEKIQNVGLPQVELTLSFARAINAFDTYFMIALSPLILDGSLFYQ